MYPIPGDMLETVEAGAYTRPLLSSTLAVFGPCTTEPPQRFPQTGFTLSRTVDECKPLGGVAAAGPGPRPRHLGGAPRAAASTLLNPVLQGIV